MKESLQSYIQRGGKVQHIKKGSKVDTATTSYLLRKDPKLRAMKNLLKKATRSEDIKLIEQHIDDRIVTLIG